jgi:bacterial/archaeal transporter family-2 protein
MYQLGFVVMLCLVGGIAVAVQAAFAGVLTEKIGLVENAFIVFGIGFFGSLLVLIIFGRNNFEHWRSVPWYIYFAGFLGIVIITSIGYSIPKIGVASTLTVIIVSQLVVGALFDHFGWLTSAHPIDLNRLIGFGLLFLGTWIVLR